VRIVGGRALVAGRASGPAVLLGEALSFWGGFDPESGVIIDRRHPQHRVVLTGTVVVMPGGRGSSSSSSVIAEAIRRGTAPAAVVLREADGIVALGALVARELYGRAMPVVVATAEVYDSIEPGEPLAIECADQRRRADRESQ
jgi:predicted aconitase with swiveling domain